jgi:hypothetical protein
MQEELIREGKRSRGGAAGGIALLFAVTIAAGCSGMSTTQQRVLSGGAIGAGGGAVIGAIAGNAGIGAAAGAGAGLLGGYLYDSYEKSKESSYRQGYQAGRASK